MENKNIIDPADFPSNSKTKVGNEKPEVRKVITGKVVKQKRTLGKRIAETFLGGDTRSVGDYILHDVLIPAAKDMIFDMIKGGAEMSLFGEKKGRNTSRDRGKSYVSYSSYYKSDKDRDSRDKRDSREISRSARAKHDFDEIILETRGEAEEVLSQLVDLTIDYGMASVADLYDSVDITSSFTDHKYGWTDLKSANVSRVRGGYLINLPRPITLD